MNKLKEQCVTMMLNLTDDKATAELHAGYVNEFKQVARAKSCPKLEKFLAQELGAFLGKMKAMQVARYRS